MNIDDHLHSGAAGELHPLINWHDYHYRNATAERIAKVVQSEIGFASEEQWAQTLHNEGLLPIGVLLGHTQVNDILMHFAQFPVFNGHVKAFSDQKPRHMSKDYNHKYASFDDDAVVNAPYLLDLALREDIVNTAEKYLGCTPTIYSMHAWWAFPSQNPSGIEHYHRDYDDYRFVALIMYLTPVTEQTGGEHVFIKEFQRLEHLQERFGAAEAEALFRAFRPPEWYAVNCPDWVTRVYGPPGACFMADTFSLHRAGRTNQPRLAVWIRYGLFRNQAYATDRTRPVRLARYLPMSGRQQWMTRLIVQHS